MSAADYIDLLQAPALDRPDGAGARGYDAMLSPTVPIVAPAIAPLWPRRRLLRGQSALLRNPSMVNLLDGCALSLPCQRAGEMPVGLMVWSGALADDRVLDAGLAIEAALAAALAA